MVMPKGNPVDDTNHRDAFIQYKKMYTQTLDTHKLQNATYNEPSPSKNTPSA